MGQRIFSVLLMSGLLACGDNAAVSDGASTSGPGETSGTAATSGSGETSGTVPTSGATASTGGVTTTDTGGSGTATTEGVVTTTEETGTGLSGTSTGDGSETGSSGGSGGSSTGDTTTSGAEACVSDTSADPAAWSVSRGAPDKALNVQSVGTAAGAVLYATGFNGVVDLGGGPIDSKGGFHIGFASHSSAGEFLWADHIGGPVSTLNISGFDAAVDCGGNLVIGGQFDWDIFVQGVTLSAVPGLEFNEGGEFPTVDWFLVKFGPDGKLLWAKRFGDEASQRMYGLDVQGDGTIVVSGQSLGTLELGGPPIVAPGPLALAVLAAFTPDGGFAWQRSFSGSQGVGLVWIDVGPDDRISVLGTASGSTDLGGGLLTDVEDPWIVGQFAADGSHRWSHRLDQADHIPWYVGADAAGGTVISGSASTGEFVLRHDTQGALDWERTFVPAANTAEQVSVEAMATGATIAVAGRFRGAIDFGGGDLNVAPPEHAMFVARYDLAGEHLSSEMFNATLEESPNAAAIGADGELVLGGTFQGQFDLGAGPMVAVGEADLFVHRFAP